VSRHPLVPSQGAVGEFKATAGGSSQRNDGLSALGFLRRIFGLCQTQALAWNSFHFRRPPCGRPVCSDASSRRRSEAQATLLAGRKADKPEALERPRSYPG